MKGNEAKMPRMEDILKLPVQDPSGAEFSAAHINWIMVEGRRQGGDDIALIPFARVNEFVKGESSNPECPANFRIESRRKRPEGSVSKPRVDGYLEYTLYWCSYGPEDYRDNDFSVEGNSNAKPASGKGSRPGRRHMMRGCLCHFTVKRLYTRPFLALIIYNQRSHVDKNGAPCHGILDRDALGTRAMYAPRISEELRQRVMSMLYLGVSLEDILHHHTDAVQRHGGPQNRDDFLARNDVRNMERAVRNSSHELHPDDECSMRIWVQRHQKHVFLFQESSSSEPLILGIQTDWQMQQMHHYGQNGCIASHSTFGIDKLKFPLSSILVFDSSQNVIPVAWVITSCGVGQCIHKVLTSLVVRIRAKDPGWRPNAFLLDDPSFEISYIREIFQCRISLCLWHVRRAWVKNLMKRCCNFDVQREMFKVLGCILYCTRSGSRVVDAIEEFMQVFIDQCAFMDYFKSQWLPRLDLWVNGIRTLPVSTPEPYAAIESYHLRLKSKLFEEQNSNFWLRVDWLIHILTTEVHSAYWFHQYATKIGFFENIRDDLFSLNSWTRALHIPDSDVLLDEQNLQLAKVLSQTDRNLAYTIWNPGSEFSVCDCPWSRQGNLCKHVIKISVFCKNRHVTRPFLSFQVYRHALLTLLQGPPDDPVVIDHAVQRVIRLQQEIKGLEELSDSGLLQPLPPGPNSQLEDNFMILSRSQ